MRKINFLIKLNQEGKLQEVEPSDEIKEAYLQRSGESLSSAKALLRIGNLKERRDVLESFRSIPTNYGGKKGMFEAFTDLAVAAEHEGRWRKV